MYTLRHRLDNHKDSVLCVDFHSDLGLFATGGQDGRISLWSIDCWNLLSIATHECRSVLSLCFSRETLISLGRDNSLYLWSLPHLHMIHRMSSFPSPMLSMALIPALDSPVIALGSMDTCMYLVNMGELVESSCPTSLRLESHHSGYVLVVKPSLHWPGVFYSGSGDGSIGIWNQELLTTFTAHSDRAVTCLAESVVDNRVLLISGSKDGVIKLWRLSTPESTPSCLRTVEMPSEVLSLSCIRDSIVVSTRCGTNGQLTLLDTSLNSAGFLSVHGFGAQSLVIFHSREYLFTGSDNGCIFVWDNNTTCSRHHASLEHFLDSIGLSQYNTILSHNKVDLDSLGLLSNTDFEHLGIPLGHRRLILAQVAATPRLTVPSSSQRDPVRHMVQYLQKFIELPSISKADRYREDSWKCAQYAESILLKMGAETKIMHKRVTKNPTLMARLVVGSSSSDLTPRRVVFYGHYDVQPATEPGWDTEPFTCTGINGYLYGRGVSDNKGPIVAVLVALEELVGSKSLDAPVEVILMLDGEEENSSEAGGFYDAVAECCKEWITGPVDAIFIANTSWLGTDRPCLVYGMRGVIKMQITVSGPDSAIHSGVHGGAVYEPMSDMVHILGQLTGSSPDQCPIPGFYDHLQPMTREEELILSGIPFDVTAYKKHLGVSKLCGDQPAKVLLNRWRMPTLSIHDITTGSSSSTGAISNQVAASLSMRTVPNQDHSVLEDGVRMIAYRSMESLASENRLHVEVLETQPWWRGDLGGFAFSAAASAIERVWGVPPLYIREGGSIPTSDSLEKLIGAPVVHVPFSQENDRAHLDNERIRLLNLVNGKKVFQEFVQSIAKGPSKVK